MKAWRTWRLYWHAAWSDHYCRFTGGHEPDVSFHICRRCLLPDELIADLPRWMVI